jgi:hypothetical protein
VAETFLIKSFLLSLGMTIVTQIPRSNSPVSLGIDPTALIGEAQLNIWMFFIDVKMSNYFLSLGLTL